MTPEEFAQLAAEGYNRIPVVEEVLADLDTPLSTYLKLAAGPNSYLLESAHGGEKWGRYSIIGLPARTVLKVSGTRITVSTDGKLAEQTDSDDPLEFIEGYMARFRVAHVPGLPRFYGGLVGYFGYDTVRYVEKRLAHSAPPDSLGTPDILLMVSDDVIVFDNLKGRMQLITLADPSMPDSLVRAQEHLGRIARRLAGPVPDIAASSANQPLDESDFVSEFGREAFMTAIEKIREYIVAGDVMQVVLAQRMSVPFSAAPINLYRALRSLNPSPYMYYMDLDSFHLVSSSPEILARVEDGVIVNRPLAGTRRRGYTEAEDKAMEAELLADPKEIAEHLMLIDLAVTTSVAWRETGSVEVTERFVIERYSQRHAHIEQCRGQIEGRRHGDRRTARNATGRHAVRRAEDSRDGDHRRTRTGETRHLWWRGRLSGVERQYGYRDRNTHRGGQGRQDLHRGGRRNRR